MCQFPRLYHFLFMVIILFQQIEKSKKKIQQSFQESIFFSITNDNVYITLLSHGL
jgi:hypothetical protein